MPPPTAGPQPTNLLNHGQPPMLGGGIAGSYYNPTSQMQNNNFSNQPMNFQTSAVHSQQQQSSSWQTQPTQPGMMGGYNDPTSQQQSTQSSHRQPQPPKEKPPLPEEYIYLQTVLDELKTNCLNAANDPVSFL